MAREVSVDTGIQPESVILTDWGADLEHLGSSPDIALYELLLLSLLYDRVLIQDEVFAQSRRFARWFSDRDRYVLLEKCLEVGGVTVLTHPLGAYHNDQLRELASHSPIMARGKYSEEVSTKEHKPFRPTTYQHRFYHLIDESLLRLPQARREAGSNRPRDIMGDFAALLREVLSSGHYNKWRGAAFSDIRQDMADQFLGFIDEPARVITELRKRGISPKYVGADTAPVFNRSLAFQASTMYPSRNAKAMQRLVQTVFAVPLCWREEAAGRYSGRVRELPLIGPDDLKELEGLGDREELVSLEACVDVPLALPALTNDFVEAVGRVRQDMGRRLREPRIAAGADMFDLERLHVAWLEVADHLARRAVGSPVPVTIRSLVVRVGGSAVAGTFVRGLWGAATGALADLPATFALGMIGGTFLLAGGVVAKLIRRDLLRQRIRAQIERAVRFRCNPLQAPPVLFR